MRPPLLLDPANLTPPARTPWGGRRIAQVIKAGLLDPDRIAGESWELSLGPELPSRLDGSSTTLAEAIAPETSALLVKLLDAAQPLSVQIHPRDGDPGLAADESGKPEAWYVEHAEPGAGIWIGLAEHAGPESVARAIARGEDLSRELHFCEVAPGDFFSVEAGTPHAIGAGVTVVEPQRVLPGKRGVTYRYWDWNRLYDGAPRRLDVERALAVTDWARARGERLLEAIRIRAGAIEPSAPIALRTLARGEIGLHVWRASGSGALALEAWPTLRSITVLEGEAVLDEVGIGRGRTAAIPGGDRAHRLLGRSLHALLAASE